MKPLLICVIGVLAASANATDIDLKMRVVTFTNLQGRAYESVRLSRANNDGVVYFNENGGGMVLYTNLALAQLASWNLSTNLAKDYLDRQEAKRQAKIEAEQDRQRQLELKRQERLRAQKAAEEYQRTNKAIEYYAPPRTTPRNRIGLGA